jgi:hypothetical protein
VGAVGAVVSVTTTPSYQSKGSGRKTAPVLLSHSALHHLISVIRFVSLKAPASIRQKYTPADT